MPSLEAQVAALGGPVRRRRPHIGWAQVIFVGLLVIGSWLVLAFASTFQQLNEATASEASVQADIAAFQQRIDDGDREIALVQSDAFRQLEARAYGMGAPGEQVFSLEPGAPSPAPLAKLGAPPVETQSETPLDAWLNLLFGN
jgi:cell division protein FtsB